MFCVFLFMSDLDYEEITLLAHRRPDTVFSAKGEAVSSWERVAAARVDAVVRDVDIVVLDVHDRLGLFQFRFLLLPLDAREAAVLRCPNLLGLLTLTVELHLYGMELTTVHTPMRGSMQSATHCAVLMRQFFFMRMMLVMLMMSDGPSMNNAGENGTAAPEAAEKVEYRTLGPRLPSPEEENVRPKSNGFVFGPSQAHQRLDREQLFLGDLRGTDRQHRPRLVEDLVYDDKDDCCSECEQPVDEEHDGETATCAE
mmetsp:Transcript_20015/g.35719  ORF Transcript_20015/g.35719 Transcript_20015/m.35719 type:complete len:255 (-) Transcript_20015:287-1051(-)